MEHNLFMQAYDNDGNLHKFQFHTIVSYLVEQNHVRNGDWKFHKAIIYGKELVNEPGGNLGVTYFRDISDFNTFCRRHCERKEIKTAIPKDIIRKFLLQMSDETRNSIYADIQNGNSINHYFTNGGGGMCEYRPGYIEGWDFFKAQGVEIQWINEDADLCTGMISRGALQTDIKVLIKEGIYCSLQKEVKPKIVFYEDRNQLQGQLSIADWLTA